MYSFDSRIRYSEVDSHGYLSLSGLNNYFQDCSVFHSESKGVGMEYLAGQKVAWILLFWQICIDEMPKLNEEVTIATWPYEMKAFYGFRNFQLSRKDGTRLAYANSVWALVDTETGRPMKIPDEITDIYGLDPQLPMDCCERKIKLPDSMENVDSVTVPSYFIDTNNHMNNEKYVTLAMNHLPEEFKIKEVRVEYKKAAMLGDVIHKSIKVEDDRVTVALSDDNGKPYSVVVFIGSK